MVQGAQEKTIDTLCCMHGGCSIILPTIYSPCHVLTTTPLLAVCTACAFFSYCMCVLLMQTLRQYFSYIMYTFLWLPCVATEMDSMLSCITHQILSHVHWNNLNALNNIFKMSIANMLHAKINVCSQCNNLIHSLCYVLLLK